MGCTKRVGLFHPDRSKLQKPGGPPHGRRRSCKGTLPPLSKDSKKQVRGDRSLSPARAHGVSAEARVYPQLGGLWGRNLFPILGMWGGHQALGLSLNCGDTGWALSTGFRFWSQLGGREVGAEPGVCP